MIEIDGEDVSCEIYIMVTEELWWSMHNWH